jgi:hypothetical protein
VAQSRKGKGRIQFPSISRNLRAERIANKDILTSLLDIKTRQSRYHRVNNVTKETETGDERYKV